MSCLHRLLLLSLFIPSLAFAALKVEVRVEGLDGAMLQNVMQQLSIQRERNEPLLDLYRLRRLQRRAPDEIAAALQPFGYYHATVDSSLTRRTDGSWLADYRVTPGPPTRVAALQLEILGPAAQDPAFAAWRAAFPLKVGGVLDQPAYEQAKRELLQLARDRGYFKAQLERHTIEVNLKANSAKVVLILASGPRYTFGEPHFDKVALNENLLRRFLTFQPGQPYDVERLFQMQRALADSDYFNLAEVTADPKNAVAGRVPVLVHLRLRPQNRYTFGLGYGTDTGPRLSIGMERRRVNSAGHRVSVDTSISQIQSSVNAVYRIPLDHPDTDTFAFSTGWQHEALDVSSRETLTASAGITQQIAHWQRTMALTVQNERYSVADQSNITTLVLPSIGWQRVEADDRMFPRRGWRLGFELRGASETLGSDASLLQTVLNAKAIYPLGDGRLITRANLGASTTPDFSRIPVSLRFFAGGDSSVRGYAYNSLGPTDAQGQVVGGLDLLVVSAEYDRYFSEHFGAAVFFDAGNAFDNSSFVPAKGAGVGLRWRLPFGVIRIDVASPVRDAKPDWRLHITLGPDL